MKSREFMENVSKANKEPHNFLFMQCCFELFVMILLVAKAIVQTNYATT